MIVIGYAPTALDDVAVVLFRDAVIHHACSVAVDKSAEGRRQRPHHAAIAHALVVSRHCQVLASPMAKAPLTRLGKS